MLVRIESVRGTSDYLVIDEIDRVWGYCRVEVIYDCLIANTSSVEIDDYEYHHVDKELIKELCYQ